MSDIKLARHFVGGFVVIAALASIFLFLYSGISDSYDLTDNAMQYSNETGQTGNIMYQLNEMNFVEGINQFMASIADLQQPTASGFDILGALASVGIGIIKIIFGTMTLPYSVISIITTYYANEVAGVVFGMVAQMAIVYLGFILLSAYLRSDV